LASDGTCSRHDAQISLTNSGPSRMLSQLATSDHVPMGSQIFEAKRSPIQGVGDGIYATQDIPAGTVILSTDNPLICIPGDDTDGNLNNVCSWCMVRLISLEHRSSLDVNFKLAFCNGCKVVK